MKKTRITKLKSAINHLNFYVKSFFSKAKERKFPKPTISYRNNARRYVGESGTKFEFCYATNKKSAVVTGVEFISDDEIYKEVKSSNPNDEIREKWFYFFIGLV